MLWSLKLTFVFSDRVCDHGNMNFRGKPDMLFITLARTRGDIYAARCKVFPGVLNYAHLVIIAFLLHILMSQQHTHTVVIGGGYQVYIRTYNIVCI